MLVGDIKYTRTVNDKITDCCKAEYWCIGNKKRKYVLVRMNAQCTYKHKEETLRLTLSMVATDTPVFYIPDAINLFF